MGIGCAIGAGFFLGSGIAINKAGPSLLIAYVLGGAVIFLVMRALGELALAYPSSGSFSTYAHQWINPLAGFIVGWSYWMAISVACIAESTGIALLVRHWYPNTPQWIPALGAVAVLYVINMSGVRSFGELEFWLAMIKVITIVGVVLCGLAILFFKFGDLGPTASLSNLWTHGGFFPAGLPGLINAMPVVIFAFAGLEVIGLAAAEADDPQRTLPKAINGVFYRVLFLYVGSFAIIMMVLPWNQINPQESPFILLLQHAGLSTAASVVTFVAITALFSSFNTAIFATSRMLHGLASAGQAPARLRRLNKQNIPSLAVTVSGLISMIGVLLNYLIPDKIFSYVLTMITWLIMVVWSSIVLSHLFYVRSLAAKGAKRGDFQLWGTPYTNWVLLFAMVFIAITFAISGGTRITLYILMAWFGLLLVGYYGLAARTSTAYNPGEEVSIR
ncbi:amino acid permease [Granulicella sp. dw_53]|uniref:amino acid permease n=1 Tax=Granulicella sp. dw_53 TaxID=2719792 RepID=UPI001BD33AF5|nr:amino acid permease [Granulicella sp. dw_53]